MAVIPPRFGTCAGLDRLVVVPSPSVPLPFSPQLQTVPSLRSARELAKPAATARMFDSPGTATGERRVVSVPSPSCPKLLRPQAATEPSGRTARLCAKREETWTALKPGMGAGV